VPDSERTLSDIDQSTADSDQSASDLDQRASVTDAALSTADQSASDQDQAAADRELARANLDKSQEREHELARATREKGTVDRTATALLRAQTAVERFASADQRDESARLRDLAARARDRAAEARDRLLAQSDAEPQAEALSQAAVDRARAAADRERAAADREQAAADRAHARAALSYAHVDELTGTFRRGVGDLALQGEIDRARRTAQGRLVLAFVDVDGLKEVNDREGHAAGDGLLVEVVASIRAKLRSYDPVVRFGGDEFVCALTDADLPDAQRRFDEIQSALRESREHGSISVGLARLEDGDTLDDLARRADSALYAAKRERVAAKSARRFPRGKR
jgi:diguanylate cyclase (GGDEF)-like protein